MRACETALRECGAGAGITRYAQQEWGRGRNHAADEDKKGGRGRNHAADIKKGGRGRNHAADEDKNGAGDGTMLPKQNKEVQAKRERNVLPGDTGPMIQSFARIKKL